MFAGFQPAPNQGSRPELCELENRAIDPDGVVLAAMREVAPWSGRALVDLGCGSGFRLAGCAAGLAEHPDALGLTYGHVLFAVRQPGASRHYGTVV